MTASRCLQLITHDLALALTAAIAAADDECSPEDWEAAKGRDRAARLAALNRIYAYGRQCIETGQAI